MKLKIPYILAVLSFGLSTLIAASSPKTSSLPSSTPEQSAQFEKVRRQDMFLAAQQALMDADRLLADKNYDSAVERYQFVLDSVTDTGASKIVYQRAEKGLAAAKANQASILAQNAQFAKAADLLRQSIALDPNNPNYPAQIEALKKAQLDYVEKTRDPEGSEVNPAVTPEFKDKVAAAAKLLFQGDRYFETGQYEKAGETYSKVLILDPYNKAARDRMEKMERYKEKSAELRHEEFEQEKLNQVNADWETHITTDIVVADKPQVATIKQSNRVNILKKLQTLVVDKVNFDKLDIHAVVDFLTEKSKEIDPEHVGINFVLRLTSNASTAPPAAAPGAAPAPAGATTPPAPVPQVTTQVSLTLEKVPLANVLDLITEETKLQYSVEDYAVYLRPSVDEGEFVSVRTYQAPPTLFAASDITAAGGAAGATSAGGFQGIKTVTRDVVTDLKNLGISFDVPGSTATLLTGSGKLVVRNTPEQLDLISAVIDQYSQDAPQVTIQAKIAEFTDSAYKEFASNILLGFNGLNGAEAYATGYAPGGTLVGSTLQAGTANRTADFIGTTGSGPNGGIEQNSLDALIDTTRTTAPNPFTGASSQLNSPSSLFLGAVIDGHGLGILINALNNTAGVSLISAPSVTTQNNQKANIDIVQEFPYATTFQAPKLAPNNFYLQTYIPPFDLPIIGGGFVIGGGYIDYTPVTMALPGTPSDFTTKDVGVSLEVKPTIYADKRIDLDITHASVVDFDGFINYGENVQAIYTTSQTTASVLTDDIVNLPVFNTRSMQTRLQVLDGQTAILGGLLREDTQEVNDKVPVLGDLPLLGKLFQSKVSQRIKKNLMFFITANLIKTNGKPVYTKTLTAEVPEQKSVSIDPGANINLPPLP